MRNFTLARFIVFSLVLIAGLCSAANKVIFISLDGFRHDYLEIMKAAGRNISAFDEIRNGGFQAEIQNVMLTLTFPSHYAMATGRTVENHGLVGNVFYDPTIKQTYKYTKTERNLESNWFEYDNSEPLWLTNQRHGKRSCVFQWVGSEARIRDKMGFATSGVYNGAYSLRYRIDRMLDWIQRDEFSLCMLYFNEPDSQGHKYGPDSEQVKNAIEDINEGLAYLLQRIKSNEKLNGKTNLVVSADHGMTNVDPAKRLIDVSAMIKKDQYIGDGSPATLGLWSMNYSSKPDPSKTYPTLQQIYDKIKNIPHLSVYWKKDIPQEYHFKNNYRIAPIYAIADIGWLIDSQGRPYTNLYGMHGYNNSEPDMHPFMVACGPDIKSLSGIQKFHQIDIYPYICAMLGLDQPNRIDGQIDRTLEFLKTPPAADFLTKFKLHAYPTTKP